MLSEQDETPRSKDRSATSDGMLSVDRDDERATARDEQETERCRPAARPLRPKATADFRTAVLNQLITPGPGLNQPVHMD